MTIEPEAFGNNIPDSYLRRFLPSQGKEPEDTPDNEDLAQFLEDL